MVLASLPAIADNSPRPRSSADPPVIAALGTGDGSITSFFSRASDSNALRPPVPSSEVPDLCTTKSQWPQPSTHGSGAEQPELHSRPRLCMAAPNKRRAAGSAAEPQDLCRLLLTFKLRVSAVKSGVAAVEECRAAAEALESCVASLEQSQPLLQRALHSASPHAASEVKCEELALHAELGGHSGSPMPPSNLLWCQCCAGQM
jgi:hypothetical protein